MDDLTFSARDSTSVSAGEADKELMKELHKSARARSLLSIVKSLFVAAGRLQHFGMLMCNSTINKKCNEFNAAHRSEYTSFTTSIQAFGTIMWSSWANCAYEISASDEYLVIEM